ncbi:MAG: hypothetical protein D8M59_16780 [Planctomycetes bacterium]|nr:hypothetical protein [Planctomycetota bacterium]
MGFFYAPCRTIEMSDGCVAPGEFTGGSQSRHRGWRWWMEEGKKMDSRVRGNDGRGEVGRINAALSGRSGRGTVWITFISLDPGLRRDDGGEDGMTDQESRAASCPA